MNSRELRAKISALDATVQQWESEIDALVLRAVEGDADAAQALAQTNAKLEGARADRVILEKAYKQMLQAEAEAFAAAEAEAKTRYVAEARVNAERLLATARKADGLISELKAVLTDLTSAETDVWNSLRLAGVTPPGAIIGRKGISGHVVDILKACADGRENFRNDKRTTSEVVEIGWQFLIDNKDEAA